MFYLLLAILSSALISIFMRISEKRIKNQMAMFMANYAVCTVLSILFMNPNRDTFTIDLSSIAMTLGAISGVL